MYGSVNFSDNFQNSLSIKNNSRKKSPKKLKVFKKPNNRSREKKLKNNRNIGKKIQKDHHMKKNSVKQKLIKKDYFLKFLLNFLKENPQNNSLEVQNYFLRQLSLFNYFVENLHKQKNIFQNVTSSDQGNFFPSFVSCSYDACSVFIMDLFSLS